MRWKDLRRSSNVRDVRGAGGGGVRMPIGRGGRVGGGLGALVLVVLVLIFGGPEAVMQLLSGGGSAPSVEQGRPLTANDETSDFVARVLGSTEDVWSGLFRQQGQTYQPPELNVFDGAVQSRCGFASSASGPFYCPVDRRIYLDTAFFDELARMGGPGDFAAAYVIGHEVGHHVQTLLGTADQVRDAQQRLQRDGSESAASGDGAAGRLLCRRLGLPRESSDTRARARRRRGRPRCGGGDRRRHAATQRRPRRDAGLVHARFRARIGSVGSGWA